MFICDMITMLPKRWTKIVGS